MRVRRALLAALGFYQRWISPALHTIFPGGCRYHPNCSQYAVEALELHGTARGCWLALLRLLRCHPLARGGFDPVPLPVSQAASQVQEHKPLP